MRIIAGQWRGSILKAPSGSNTRPTVDRVRESLMSSIASMRKGFDGACVLDAFAGSGALGLESLSRGAQLVWFYESDRKAFSVLSDNVAKFDLGSDSAVLKRADVFAQPPLRFHQPFDLVFLDPPYAMSAQDVFSLLDKLAQAGALSDDALVCYEHARADDIVSVAHEASTSWIHRTHKTYGETAIDVFERTPA